MHNKQEVLVIIPARSGSKGVPQKNIRLLCGKPLIAYAIEAALRSGCAGRVVVSTDDEAIARVAVGFGAEVPFLRPREMARDDCPLGPVIDDALARLAARGYEPDIVVELYPSHVFRSPRLIRELVGLFARGYKWVVTAKPVTFPAAGFFTLGEDDRARPLDPLDIPTAQGDRPYFLPQGLFVGRAMKGGLRSGVYYHPLHDDISLVDIDSMRDWLLAEAIIRDNLFDFSLQ